MEKNCFIQSQFPKAERNFRGAAEDEGIYDSCVGGKFPDKEETKQD